MLSLGALLSSALGGETGPAISTALVELQSAGSLKDDAARERWAAYLALSAVLSVSLLFAAALGKP